MPDSRPPIEVVLEGQVRGLGDGPSVRRLLPQIARRHVGPFVFFDHLPPATFGPGEGFDVRPHPHIGLATVTWLFEGAMVHRDSLGVHQVVRPGELNWMTAGRGITHSERTSAEDRATGGRLHVLQTWVALPTAHEEAEPAFHHYPAEVLPSGEVGGAAVRLLVGAAWGLASPVATFSPVFYAVLELAPGASVPVPGGYAELGVFVVDGAVTVGGTRATAGQLAVLGSAASIDADEAARAVLIGGDPPDGPRHVWWNFVSSRKERITEAADAWRQREFPPIPGDDDEFIPLP